MGTETSGVGQVIGGDQPYEELIAALDHSVQTIREAALALKRAAAGIQAVERNADRILASTRMLELNVSDLTGRPTTMASWAEDGGEL